MPICASKIYDWTKQTVTKDFHFNENNLDFFLKPKPSPQELPINPYDFFGIDAKISIHCVFKELACRESGPRTDNFIKGLNTTLQTVKISKTGSFQVVLTCEEKEAQLFSKPLEFTVFEEMILCAPEGTEVLGEVYAESCNGYFSNDGRDWCLDLTLFLCQSLYVQLEVILEINGTLANPRKDFIAQELRCDPIVTPSPSNCFFPA